jgi:N-formylglutamate amidohydrolase
MNEILLNIPHSSKYIPTEYINDYFDTVELNETVLKLTDIYTDDLFDVPDVEKVIFQYSRIFCDVERFLGNEDEEPMVKYGQGVFYTNGINGKAFRKYGDEYCNITDVLIEYYEPYIDLFKNTLQKIYNPLIIDCHSFSNEIYPCTPFYTKELPDFILGHNGKEYEIKLCFIIYQYLVDLGYKVNINTPYSGSFTVHDFPSIMIEVNKRLYLLDDYITKKSDYYKIKDVISSIIRKVKDIW